MELQRCVLLCNSCVLTQNGLNSDSPDEMALLNGFLQLGGFVAEKDDKHVTMKLLGDQEESWELLRVNMFTSERKRMSVVARNRNSGQIRIYMKVSCYSILSYRVQMRVCCLDVPKIHPILGMAKVSLIWLVSRWREVHRRDFGQWCLRHAPWIRANGRRCHLVYRRQRLL